MNFTALSELGQIQINRDGEAIEVGFADGVESVPEAAKSICFHQNCILCFTKFTLAVKNLIRFCSFSTNCSSGHRVLYVILFAFLFVGDLPRVNVSNCTNGTVTASWNRGEFHFTARPHRALFKLVDAKNSKLVRRFLVEVSTYCSFLFAFYATVLYQNDCFGGLL